MKIELVRCDPVSNDGSYIEMEETIQQQVKATCKELSKSKPRDSVLLPLM